MKRRIVEVTDTDEVIALLQAAESGALDAPDVFERDELVDYVGGEADVIKHWYADAEQLRAWREARATDKSTGES